MDFKKMTMRDADDVFRNMADGTTPPPLNKKADISPYVAYTSKRAQYAGRLNIEKNAFNLAIKTTRAEHARRKEKERLNLLEKRRQDLERQAQKKKAATSVIYWCFVAVAAAVNVILSKKLITIPFYASLSGTEKNEAFYSALINDMLKFLIPAWIVVIAALLLTGFSGNKLSLTTKKIFVAVAVEVVPLLIYAAVLGYTFPPNESIGENISGCLILCAMLYFVPVTICGLIISKMCKKTK